MILDISVAINLINILLVKQIGSTVLMNSFVEIIVHFYVYKQLQSLFYSLSLNCMCYLNSSKSKY